MTPTSSSAAPSLLWSLPGSPTDADVALIVCPYAGGTAQAFANELRWLVPDHDVRYLALPGRTHRMTEAPYEDLATLVDDLEWELAMMGKPFIIAGYSIGARIGLATAERCTVAGSALIGLLPAMSAVGPHGERRWGTDLESVAKDIRRSHPSGDELHHAGLLDRVAAQTSRTCTCSEAPPSPATGSWTFRCVPSVPDRIAPPRRRPRRGGRSPAAGSDTVRSRATTSPSTRTRPTGEVQAHLAEVYGTDMSPRAGLQDHRRRSGGDGRVDDPPPRTGVPGRVHRRHGRQDP